MDFIIGGCYQGKRSYVKAHYGFDDSGIIGAEDVRENDMQGKRCLAGFHLYVRSLMEAGQNIEENISALFQKNDISVIISDEIGYGIVPVSAFEREYRETVGRQSCLLAQKADRVIRVVSGVGMVIKDVTDGTPGA